MKKIFRTLLAAAVLVGVAATGASAAELKISGSSTVGKRIIIPNKDAIEKETGLTLNMTMNGDGNGLHDLYAGASEVAMTSAPMTVTEAAMNKATPGSVSIAGFQEAKVGAVSIKFIVNPANPVKALTEAQLKDIFTGKITSWKDVGGSDQPILVVAEVPGGGTRANVVTILLGGAEISEKASLQQALQNVATVVGQAPNAIGYSNSAWITDAVAVIPGYEVKQSLGLTTKGEPNASVKKLIESVAKYGASVN
ncbi:MAG: substrate-binding domain-containing protein [Pseudomonadota bacterium]